jgi:hypothetical protein
VIGSTGLIFKEQGREVAKSLDMTDVNVVKNMHFFSIEYRFVIPEENQLSKLGFPGVLPSPPPATCL